MTVRCLLPLLCAVALTTPAAAQDAVDKKKLDAAIDTGLKYLKGLQQPDGSFKLPPVKTDTLETTFKMGFSSLATLTLLKCGVPPGDKSIERAFQHLYTLPLRRTYSVSLLILCIEARYAPPQKLLAPGKKAKSYVRVAQKFFRGKARKADRVKLQECVNYLLTNRSKKHDGLWRYPSTAEVDQDNSNTQYALLAMKGARRLGARIPIDVFEKVADFFVAQQDATGAKVPWFGVPAADGPIAEMLTLEKRRKLLEKHKEEEEKRGTRVRKRGGKEIQESRGMFARGWSYEPRKVEDAKRGASREGPVPTRTVATQRSTGSMTASGVAALCIAKSELELSKRSWLGRRDQVNTAIRDGCAWLAKYWNPTANPCSGPKPTVGWKYYYLYSCERAGVLAGTYRFGQRDWWEEGAAHLIKEQRKEGSWPDTKGISRLGRTCFALLFLKRATIPLVPLPPKRVMTGSR